MLSRIHVCAASLGLLLAGPAVAAGQSSEAVMLDRASAAAKELPSYKVMGIAITPHQFSVLGPANVEEQSPSPSLMMAGMPASPHQVAVLTPRPKTTEQATAAKLTTVGLPAR